MTNGELHEGDCIKVLRTKIGDGTVDAVIADPPYGTTKCDWDSRIPLDDMWYQLWRVLKPTGVIVLTSSQPFTAILINSNPGDFKHEWIWIKNRGSNFANTKREPAKEHEHVLVFCRRGGWTYKCRSARAGANPEANTKQAHLPRQLFTIPSGRSVSRCPNCAYHPVGSDSTPSLGQKRQNIQHRNQLT